MRWPKNGHSLLIKCDAMIVIGQNLNLRSRQIREAARLRDPKPIRDLALAQFSAGVDLVEVNLGPTRGGSDLMTWLVKTVREVTDLPLCLDATDVTALEAGLRAADGKALINSIPVIPERTRALMPLAVKYGVPFIGLTFGTEGMPRDAHERGLLAAELVAEAATYGIREQDIWIDPIVLPLRTQPLQVQSCLEFVRMLLDLHPLGKSVCGLSNISKGVPRRLRGVLNRTWLVILKRCGLHSVIANSFDKELCALAKGEMKGLEAVVQRVIDGEDIDIVALSGKERDFVRTAEVLLGRTVFTDLWLHE